MKKREEGEEEFKRGLRVINKGLSNQIEREMLLLEKERNENIMRVYDEMREEYVSRYVLGEDMFDIKNEYKK
jgi:hypothetical protein